LKKKRDKLVRSLPLLGMPFFMMTSNAETRSVATKRRASSWPGTA
jgi:hypothetical protein